jgi:RNA polymerase sigma-70 factor, ECF subfamily
VVNTNDDYRQFFLAEHPRVIAMVLAYTGQVELARDIAQETMLRAYQHWAAVSAMDKPAAWTRRVAINLSITAFRKRSRDDKLNQRLGAPPPLLPTDPVSDRFWAEVRNLPERQRAAIALYYLDDLPLAEIADILDCAEGTVKSLLFKGRTRLAERLASEVA